MSNIIEYLKEVNRFNEMTTIEIFNEIVEGYVDTCHSMADEDFDWLDRNGQLEAFDSEIFYCVQCGWWCPDGEQSPNENYEPTCDDCDPEE